MDFIQKKILSKTLSMSFIVNIKLYLIFYANKYKVYFSLKHQLQNIISVKVIKFFIFLKCGLYLIVT